MGIIIAAGALFTAVYDVLYRYNSSNTINLNAATVDKTGETFFGVEGTKGNGNETTIMNFDQGTYMVLFGGQGGANIDFGYAKPSGAVCLAFYKGSNMTVQVGVGNNATCTYHPSHGKTIVTTNFAMPNGYNGEMLAIASGSGGYGSTLWSHRYADGTFAGWEGSSWIDTPYAKSGKSGMPATQSHGGYRYDNVISSSNGRDDSGGRASAGGAGYFDGGGAMYYSDGDFYAHGGGGSCTPWSYPLYSNDIQSGPKYSDAQFYYYDWYNKTNRDLRITGNAIHLMSTNGAVYFYRIDPTVMPSSGDPVAYGETVRLVEGGVGAYTPVTSVQNIPSHSDATIDQNMGRHLRNYDVGIRVGWVYSVSEDGKSWQGVGPDGLRSATKQDI